MPALRVIILLICFLLLEWQPTMAWERIPALTPPAGYTMTIAARSIEGKQTYACDEGVWMKVGSSAKLVDSQGGKLGLFQSAYDCTKRHSNMLWTLNNSPGDQAESGFATSSISGTTIYSHKFSNEAVPELLAEVISHQGTGAASLLSYVVVVATSGGIAPNASMCTSDDTSVSVPFSAKFHFYSQDTQPPANVPQSLQPAGGQMVQGLFVKGKVVFRFASNQWQVKGFLATLYDVAGGTVVGKFGTITTADQFGSVLHWEIYDPNGFWLTGQLAANPVQVSANGAPWQLMKITSSGGTPSVVGPYRYILLTSTRGGLPPATSTGTQDGALFQSPYTGIFWWYT